MTWWTRQSRSQGISTPTSLETLSCCQEVTALNPGLAAVLHQLEGLLLLQVRHRMRYRL
jgi:hypothetical protein